MAASFSFVKDLLPRKTSWRIQVKVLHTWKTFTHKAGETFELVLADSEGTKIHASINRSLVGKYAHQLVVGEWKFIEHFSLSQASGQYRMTPHIYKLNFLISTKVSVSEMVSDSQYLSPTAFPLILTDKVNPNFLVDVMGEVVNIGSLEELESRNKLVKKIDLELRDENLPKDGLIVAFKISKPNRQLSLQNEPTYLEYKQTTIEQLRSSCEVGKVKIVCSIYAIDTDWSWYYFACKKCNKKATHVYNQSREISEDEKKVETHKFWCDTCKTVVTNVVPRYKLHVKVMDNTSKTNLMLFDSAAYEIVTQSASTLLNGSYDEIDDPESLPDAITNLKGKTFQFLVCVEKDNLCDGLDTYKVFKVLSTFGMITEQHGLEDSDNFVTNNTIMSDTQSELLSLPSQETDQITPSSKRPLELKDEVSDQSSATKRLCLEPIDVDALDDEKIGHIIKEKIVTVKIEPKDD